MTRCEICGEKTEFGPYCTTCKNRLDEEQARDRKEMRDEFKRKLDKYGVSETDKKELLALSAHMDNAD